MKYTSTGNGYHLAEFPSLSSFVDFAMAPENSTSRKGKDSDFDASLEKTETERDFSFGFNCAKIEKLLETPPASTGLIRTMAEKLNLSAHEQPRRRLRRGLEDGAELDPIGWINRRPDSWEDVRKERSAKKIFRLGINITTTCVETQENLISRAAAALAIVDAAEAAGHRCELDGIISQEDLDTMKTRKNGSAQVIRIRLKNAESPADLDTLALAVGELGFFRTMGFRGMLACYHGEKNFCTGFGICTKAPPAIRKEYDNMIDREIATETDALNYLKRFEEGAI